MKKIISITGHGNSGHLQLALDLSKNSAIGFVKPFTDRPSDPVWEDCYIFVSSEVLDKLIDEGDVLYESMVNGHRYVFFKYQLVATYNILILDDYGVAELKSKYHKQLYSIKCVSEKQKDSDRVGVYLYNHEFTEVFNYDTDNVYDLEARIEYDW